MESALDRPFFDPNLLSVLKSQVQSIEFLVMSSHIDADVNSVHDSKVVLKVPYPKGNKRLVDKANRKIDRFILNIGSSEEG
ncbi:hypothetical protein E3N88_30777 [Mikania micrantha]|uniref:Uncharacterized protein n=1 Tax=Mikania micrantha TaxID=192012 RepID=A0A5N6MN18_9ASTR|nr:hypothetical protein E3N88_30777 [Mikania micrantha]